MWQKLKSKFSSLTESVPVIGVSKRNFLMISADVKKGTLIISYKGKIRTAYFDDDTIRNMMTNKHFDKNVAEFLNGLGKLIYQVINK